MKRYTYPIRFALMLLLGLSLSLAACGDDDDDNGFGVITPNLSGTFDLQTEDGSDVSGEGSTITFNQDGTFTFTRPDCTQTGTFEITGNVLTTTVETTEGTCPDVAQGDVSESRVSFDTQGNLTLEETGGPIRTFQPASPELSGTFDLQTEGGIDVSAEGSTLTFHENGAFSFIRPDCTQTGTFETSGNILTTTVDTTQGTCPGILPGDVTDSRFSFDQQGNLTMEETGGPVRTFRPTSPEITGTFDLRTENGTDVSAEGSTMTFNEDGTFGFIRPDCTQRGTFTTVGDTLTTTVETAEGVCPDVFPGDVADSRFFFDQDGNLTLETGGNTRVFHPTTGAAAALTM